MFEKIILLIILLILGLLSKNQTIIIAILFLIAFVLLKLNNETLLSIKKFSIKYGLILITIYAFIPIAKGDITHIELINSITNYRAWIAIFAGILVTLFSKNGIEIMNTSPDVTTFVLVGIIIGIIVFKGVSSGPLIGSGMALMFYTIFDFFINLFK